MFGVLAIDKPAGVTSRDVVNRIQRLLGRTKVGHTGTLDPLATGVLLLGIGPATRLTEFAHAASKTYIAEFELGKTSDTLDVEGQVAECGFQRQLSHEVVESELKNWVGAIEQVPPKYSAIQIGGKRAYDLARQGQDFELPARTVLIHRLALMDCALPRLRLEIECGSGTYIRSLGSDVARALGTDAVMTGLVRTAIGPVSLDDCSKDMESLDREMIAARLLPPTVLLDAMPQVRLDEATCRRVRNGVKLRPEEIAGCPTLTSDGALSRPVQPLAACDVKGQLVAVLEHTTRGLRSLRVFPPQ